MHVGGVVYRVRGMESGIMESGHYWVGKVDRMGGVAVLASYKHVGWCKSYLEGDYGAFVMGVSG